MKRLISGFLLCALLPLSGAVNRTGVNSVKIPLAPGNVRISCPECSIIEPPPVADLTVCPGGGCDQLATTAGISAAIAAIANGGTIELRNQVPGVAEVWSARIICSATDGTSGSEKVIRVRDGDTVTLSTSTSSGAGLVDFSACDYWRIQGTSTGSGTAYLTNGLRIGNRTLWNQTCTQNLSCMPNERGLMIVNSTHLAFRNLSVTGGKNSLANLIDGASDQIYIQNAVFDLHGTNNQLFNASTNPSGPDDQGDLTRFYADHMVVEDSTFSHGGHQGLAARGPHQVYRRLVLNGSWVDKATGFTGNHAGNLNGGQKKNESSGLYALQTAYGPQLLEDSIITGAGFEPQHSNWNQATEFWGVGDIMRGNYAYDQASSPITFTTQCSPSGSGSYMNDYMDAHAQLYHNSTYAVIPHTGGGAGWTLASANTGVCEKMNAFNNVFQGVPTGPSGSKQYAWSELRANVPLGSYANGWKGSRLMGNIFGGPSTSMQFNLAASGGTTGVVSVTDCVRWPSNVCNNANVNLTFANGTTTPTSSKAGMALAASNAIGLGDALDLTTTTDAGTADTTLTLADAYPFKDNWGISYTFGGLHTEYGDCIAVGAAVGTAVGAATVTRITSINYTTGAIVVTPGVTHVAGSKVWKATDHGDGTCGAVWANRGANQ